MSFAHFLAFRRCMKGKLRFDAVSPPDYASRRAAEGEANLPSGVMLSPLADGMKGEFVSCPNNRADSVILYFHGGGFACGCAAARRNFTGYVAKKLGYNVWAVDYALAPEHPFPCGLRDCLAHYRAALARYGAENICIMGDSAGGNLAAATALAAKSEGLSLPACVVLISPSLQFCEELPSYIRNEATDCMLADTFLQEVRTIYLGERDPHDPFTSPLYADLSGFPPTYLIASDSEYLLDDSVRFHEKLLAGGRVCKLKIYHKKMHVFALMPAFPEARRALSDVKNFIDRYLEVVS